MIYVAPIHIFYWGKMYQNSFQVVAALSEC